MVLPIKAYYTLEDLRDCWAVRLPDLKAWLAHGELQACVALPMMSVYEQCLEATEQTAQIKHSLRHWEGYASLSRYTCQRLFKSKCISLREFTCQQSQARLSLPDTAMDIVVSIDELHVLLPEKQRFERAHGMIENTKAQDNAPTPRASHSPIASIMADASFRVVQVDGKSYSFGEIQSQVLRLLHKASLEGTPWQSGKQLLKEAGSSSFSLPNIFKRRAVWRKLIVSDQQGNYRISPHCQIEEDLGLR